MSLLDYCDGEVKGTGCVFASLCVLTLNTKLMRKKLLFRRFKRGFFLGWLCRVVFRFAVVRCTIIIYLPRSWRRMRIFLVEINDGEIFLFYGMKMRKTCTRMLVYCRKMEASCCKSV